ncbi:unnamed protein product, partial [Heterotrigona itama]
MTGNEREMGYRTGLLIDRCRRRGGEEEEEEEAWLAGFDKSVGNNGPSDSCPRYTVAN